MAEDTVKSTESDEKVNPFSAEAEKVNTERGNSKGLRVKTGFTRGKGSLAIKWEAFDESKQDTLPKSIAEFMELTGKKAETDLLDYLITGFNDAQYTAASDPIAEFVNLAWDEVTQSQFRLVVRNLHKQLQIIGKTLEDVVAMVKPGIEAAFAAKSATPKA